MSKALDIVSKLETCIPSDQTIKECIRMTDNNVKTNALQVFEKYVNLDGNCLWCHSI
jgi:hypothetical protein